MSTLINSKSCAIVIILFFSHHVFSQTVRITEEVKWIDTYAFNQPNPVPILTDNTKIFPYFKFEGYENKAEKRKWKVVTLENDYIKLFVLPEIGGKVWGAIEKKTGEEFLYKNEVIKFRNIAMRGPWTSGGIEFNFGIIGHSPATATPVDYVLKENNDGSVSCIVGNLDLSSRTRWTVEINLQKDKAYFTTKASWYNATPLNQSYYNWMTAAAEAREDLEFFIPGNQYLEHSGKARSWPIDENGRNLALYKNNNFGPHKSFHIVGDYKDFFGGYYHNSNFGFGHVSPYEEMPGQKLWLWSQSRNGGIWEDLLTDTDGQYIEFQAGRLFNQYSPGKRNPISQANFDPYVMDRWEEIWFPFKDIGGMEDASEFGVLNVEYENGELYIGVNALQKINEKLSVFIKGKEVFTKNIELDPMQVYSNRIKINGSDSIEVLVGKNMLHYNSYVQNTLFKRPFDPDPNLVVSKSEELYSEGWEAMKFRDYKKAMLKLAELINYDPSHQEGLIKLAELEYRRTNYKKALGYVNKALQMDTYNSGANYMAGIIYRELQDDISSLEALGWAARDMKYRSVSYAQMAEIHVGNSNFTAAKKYALKSLSYNKYNIASRQILLTLARKSGNQEIFTKQAKKVFEIDPINHFVDFEANLLDGNKEYSDGMEGKIQNEFSEETVLELALNYYKLGLELETVQVLSVEKSFTKIKLWLAYLLRNSDSEKSNEYLMDVLDDNSDFVFPYRRETISVLEWATSQKKHWKLNYYLAQNYLAVGKNEEGLKIIKSLNYEPDNGTFYRFRAKMLKSESYENKLKDYNKALQLSTKDWKVWNEFIQFYWANNKPDEAYALASKAYKKFRGNNSIGLSYANALNMQAKYNKSIDILKNIEVLPSEMGRYSRKIYYESHILMANKLMNQSKYKKAIPVLEKVKKWPESLGVGKPYNVDTRLEDFLLAICFKEGNDSDSSKNYLMRIVDYTNANISKPSANHLFGLLALKQLNGEVEAGELVMKLKKSAQNNKTALAIAFYKQDKVKLEELNNKNVVGDEIWKIMESLSKN